MCDVCNPPSGERKDATQSTKAYLRLCAKNLCKSNLEEQKVLVSKGLLVAGKKEEVYLEKLEIFKYDFIANNPEKSCPETAHPFLWEHAKLNMNYGLFRVNRQDAKNKTADDKFEVQKGDVFQIRGYDLANMTLVMGESGWIIMDVLTVPDTATAAMTTVEKYLGAYPVKAVIYSHSHVDHYGGVGGVLSCDSEAEIIAPKDFLQHAASENIYVGNAMLSRSVFMYGSILKKDEKGHIDAGLGKAVANGTITLRAPTKEIGFDDYDYNYDDTGAQKKCYCTYWVDGIRLQFQFTPGTEAPTEMNVYMPDYKVLFIAENCTGTLHNLYTLRGAEVRDTLDWAMYLDETIDTFSDMEIICSSHNWPHFGIDECKAYLEIQRDAYRYLGNTTLRLMNMGYTIDEIGRKMDELIPLHMQTEWCNHGFYGTVNHNAKAIYQKYLGWYDSNPCNLNRLIPTESATKYVECMGGASAVIQYAQTAYDKGEYAWAAELLNKVIFAKIKDDDGNKKNEARLLNANALEQLGYQSESAPWRNEYLTGAMILRAEAVGDGKSPIPQNEYILEPSVVNAMTPEMILQYAGILFDGYKADIDNIDIYCIVRFTETSMNDYSLTAKNGILSYKKIKSSINNPDFVGSKEEFYNLIIAEQNSLERNKANEKLKNILQYIQCFMMNFNIISPKVDS